MFRTTVIVASLVASLGITVLWVGSYIGEYEMRMGCVGGNETRQGWKIGDLRSSPIRYAGATRGQFYAITFVGIPCIRSLPLWEVKVESIGLTFSSLGSAVVIESPFWIPFLVFLNPPMILYFLGGPYRRWRRRRQDKCITCGYDLRGTDSDKCSECGTAIKSGA